jgi:competence ComEA-like helix-hairpin-helix protein
VQRGRQQAPPECECECECACEARDPIPGLSEASEERTGNLNDPISRAPVQLSTDDRRALAIILGLLVLAAAARWLERPRPLLDDLPGLDVAALEEASRAARPAARAPLGAGERVDPNTASPEELQRLPGVGAATAQRIVEARAQGPYETVADLQRVRGIGPALTARLEPLLSLPAGAAGGGGPRAAGPKQTSPGLRQTSPGSIPTVPGAPMSPAPINLNAATSAELQAIRGVGPALAGRLIARRDSLGRFREWSEVDAVPGVGPAMLARLQELAILGH